MLFSASARACGDDLGPAGDDAVREQLGGVAVEERAGAILDDELGGRLTACLALRRIGAGAGIGEDQAGDALWVAAHRGQRDVAAKREASDDGRVAGTPGSERVEQGAGVVRHALHGDRVRAIAGFTAAGQVKRDHAQRQRVRQRLGLLAPLAPAQWVGVEEDERHLTFAVEVIAYADTMRFEEHAGFLSWRWGASRAAPRSGGASRVSVAIVDFPLEQWRLVVAGSDHSAQRALWGVRCGDVMQPDAEQTDRSTRRE